jgi:hypothetical protein
MAVNGAKYRHRSFHSDYGWLLLPSSLTFVGRTVYETDHSADLKASTNKYLMCDYYFQTRRLLNLKVGLLNISFVLTKSTGNNAHTFDLAHLSR